MLINSVGLEMQVQKLHLQLKVPQKGPVATSGSCLGTGMFLVWRHEFFFSNVKHKSSCHPRHQARNRLVGAPRKMA